jgi:purine-binding chemotaxis protein CheW
MPELVRSLHGRAARREATRGPVREFLVFCIGVEFYGVDLTRIREILSPPPITPVPRSTPDVVGVCSVRGLLVTVIDLRLRLSRQTVPQGRRARILLAVAESGEIVGLLVDEVRQVVRLADVEIEPAVPALGGDLSEFVIGIGRPESMFLVLLDLSRIVSS